MRAVDIQTTPQEESEAVQKLTSSVMKSEIQPGDTKHKSAVKQKIELKVTNLQTFSNQSP